MRHRLAGLLHRHKACLVTALLLLASPATAQVCEDANVTLRSVKGASLSWAEMDANFSEVINVCSALSGLDAKIITGTPGANGTCATWNADGDLVSITCPVDTDTNTNAATICSGSLTYLDGEGNCDAYTLSGSTTVLGTTSGATTSGDCVEFDASGNLVAAGAACGTGGGSGDITAVGDCATGDCFQAVSATHALMGPGGGGVAAFRAITDADVPNTITIDLATLATTATTANAGDSATNFFPAGTLEHERGGLEADVSAFAGLLRIAAGATSAVSTLAGLNTALGSSIADGAHFVPNADPGVDHSSYVAGHGDGANCSAGNYPLGVDAAGAVQNCTPDDTGTDSADDLSDDDLGALQNVSETGEGTGIPLVGDGAGGWAPGDVADGSIPAGVSRDTESPAAGDITGSLSAGYQLGADVVGAAELADADLGQVAISGGVATVEGLQYGTAFPGSPATGDVFAVTDDSAAGACDSAAGSALTLCRWNGSAWVALGDGGGGGASSSGTGLQYGDGAGGFSEVTGSSVSGANVTLGGILGVGATPQRPLHIENTAPIIRITDSNAATGAAHNGFIEYYFGASRVGFFGFGSSSNPDFSVENQAGPINFTAGTAFSSRTDFTIESGGEVGIGDTTPSFKLDVNGTGRFVGALSADAALTMGGQQVNTPSVQTCTSNGTGTPSSITLTVSGVSLVFVDQQDPDGCAATFSETGATSGQRVEVIVSANAGGTLDFADTPTVQNLNTALSLALDDVLQVRYVVDRFVQSAPLSNN